MNLSRSNNLRHVPRLERGPDHQWQLRIGEDALITKNIGNISPTGLSFKAPAWSGFSEGDRIRMQFSISKDENFECEGKIVWAKKANDLPDAMHILGVQFLGLPARADARIMKEINENLLKGRRLLLEEGYRPLRSDLLRELNPRSIWATISAVIFLMALTAALVTATYIHQANHPEDSLSYKLNQAFQKRSVQHNF